MPSDKVGWPGCLIDTKTRLETIREKHRMNALQILQANLQHAKWFFASRPNQHSLPTEILVIVMLADFDSRGRHFKGQFNNLSGVERMSGEGEDGVTIYLTPRRIAAKLLPILGGADSSFSYS